MDIQKRKVSELIPNSQNVRRHNQNQINEFKKSVERFGVIRPIVIDENNVILAGHGLLEALKASGREEADVLVVSGLSEKDKKKLLLADNKVYSLGFDDYGVIEQILSELGKESDFDIPGFDPETLENLYGIKSVETEVEQAGTPVEQALKGIEQATTTTTGETPLQANPEPEAEPVPSKAVEEARKEAENRKFVVCPNCGERIWL